MMRNTSKKSRTYLFFITAWLSIVAMNSQAKTFPLPAHGDVVGQIQTVVIKSGDTLAQVARDYDMGYVELVEANPGVDPENLEPGTVLVLPSLYILPNAPREGLVVNLAEMRLYFYPRGSRQVITHPMGIGREGEDTPIGVLQIIEHITKPTWHVPESIRQMRAAQGVQLPKSVPPGPENPLGEYAMRLSKPTYLIHGTNDPLGGIGRRSSSGCLRLYPEDIQTLFQQVANGTHVYIVNEPYKAGWTSSGELYLESHVALQSENDQALDQSELIRNVVNLALKNRSAQVDWNKAFEITREVQGIPQGIGKEGV
jgi:L,D-transpeptidase ErfK/SrfK